MSTATQPGSSPPSTRKRWDAGIRAGVISAVIGFLALVVAVFAWLWPQQPGGTPAATGGGPGTGPGTVTTPGAATEPVESAESVAGPPAATYLDSAGFPPEAGGSDVVEVPRLIRGRAGYSSHPVAIRCPTNQTGDQTSEVTYLLRGRYVQFDATVHPYYPADSDQRAATYVTALIGIRQSDGSLDFTEAGTQKRASPTGPAALTATIDNAEKLILRIECGNPTGTVVLTDARLTPA